MFFLLIYESKTIKILLFSTYINRKYKKLVVRLIKIEILRTETNHSRLIELNF